MRRAYFIFIISFLLSVQSLLGQCPDRDSLRSCISRLQQNKSTLSIDDELGELLGYNEKMKSCPGRNDSVYTYLQIRIAIMYFIHTDYMQAIHYLNNAVRIVKENENSRLISKEHLVRSYYYLSICYDSLKLDVQQNEAIDSTIAYEMKYNSDYHFSCFLLYNSVNELFLRGDFEMLIEHASLGESIARQWYHFYDWKDFMLYFIENKTKALWSMGRYSEAEQYLNEKKDEFLKSGKNNFIAKIYRLFGFTNKAKGENQTAIQYFLKAFKYDQYTKEKEISGDVLVQVGLIFADRLQRPGMAIRYYKRALREANDFNSFYIYGDMANACVSLRNFDSADYFFQMAFDKIKPGLSDRDLVTNAGDYINRGSAEQALGIVLSKADALLERYRLEKKDIHLYEALRIYKLTDQLLNYIKGSQFSVESKLYWRSYAGRLYSHAIESAYLSGDESLAFYFFEKSRAVLLNDQLNEQNLLSREDLLKLAHLKSKVLITGRQLHKTNPSSQQYTDIEHALFSYKQELVRFQELLKKQNPVFYLRSLDTGSVSIRDVQQKLLGGQGSYVDLYSADDYLYTLVISSTDTRLLRVSRPSFDSVRTLFNSLIGRPGLLNSRFPLFVNAAGSLFRMIFQDCSLPPGRVIISPDGEYFPFEALVTSKVGEQVDYFLRSHAVSYTYSARFLLRNFYSNKSAGDKSFIGIAPVNYPSAFSLASLSGSDKSLNKISGQFPGSMDLVSTTATRRNFMQQFYKYEIIHFYTHSSGNSSNYEPVIYFADSALYLSDLVGGSKPVTKLIVLAACETGSGKDYKGEGVFSFNRGFAALGIPSSVTNLWSVDNESTYKLTELFYKYVAGGLALDEALQKAKLEFIESSESKDKQLPYYWAAAVLVGNTERIQIIKKTNWRSYLVAAGTGTGIMLLLVLIKGRRKFIPINREFKTA